MIQHRYTGMYYQVSFHCVACMRISRPHVDDGRKGLKPLATNLSLLKGHGVVAHRRVVPRGRPEPVHGPRTPHALSLGANGLAGQRSEQIVGKPLCPAHRTPRRSNTCMSHCESRPRWQLWHHIAFIGRFDGMATPHGGHKFQLPNRRKHAKIGKDHRRFVSRMGQPHRGTSPSSRKVAGGGETQHSHKQQRSNCSNEQPRSVGTMCRTSNRQTRDATGKRTPAGTNHPYRWGIQMVP